MVHLLELGTIFADLVNRVLVNQEVLHLVDAEYFLQREGQIAEQLSDRQRLHDAGDSIYMDDEVFDACASLGACSVGADHGILGRQATLYPPCRLVLEGSAWTAFSE